MLFIEFFRYVLDGNIFDFEVFYVICVDEIEKHIVQIDLVVSMMILTELRKYSII